MRYSREPCPSAPRPRAHPATRRMRICKRYPDRYAPTEYDRARPFPIVTLRGRWLQAAGFQIGDRIQIAVTPGRLVITHAGRAASDP